MRRLALSLLFAMLATTALAASEVQKGEHARYRVETKQFIVEFSVPPRIGKGYASLCEKGYAKLCKVFRVSDTDIVWEGKCRVFLFATHDEFVKFATTVHQSPNAAMSGGYTRIHKKDPDIVLFIRKDDHVTLQQTVLHEMTHVFLQLFDREVELPLWIHEGFAQYFEFQHYAPKSRRKRAMQTTKAMVKAGRIMPLSQFLISRFGPTDIVSYSQAWSLIEFMAATSDRRKKTGNFVLGLKSALPASTAGVVSRADIERLLKQGHTNSLHVQEAMIKEHFRVSLARFESEWKRYVLARY
ncbi:DUF1570 domain-containing protein [bacterium]|nr:DUF1570 domain-containing protein [bacterium]